VMGFRQSERRVGAIQILLHGRPAAIICAFLCAGPISRSGGAWAEVRVSDERGELTVEAKSASLRELLSALQKSSGLKFESSVPLDETFTGTYRGSLQQIVSSVLFLKDYSYSFYVDKNSAGAPLLQIFSSGEDPKMNSQAPPAPLPAPLPQLGQQPAPPGPIPPSGARSPHQFIPSAARATPAR
jgi:hypothetical protein